MSSLLYASRVRAVVHAAGKRCSRGYLRWLEQITLERVAADCKNSGGRKTLTYADMQLRSSFNQVFAGKPARRTS